MAGAGLGERPWLSSRFACGSADIQRIPPCPERVNRDPVKLAKVPVGTPLPAVQRNAPAPSRTGARVGKRKRSRKQCEKGPSAPAVRGMSARRGRVDCVATICIR